MSESHEAHHHIVPIPIYVAIFATLLVLTGVTVWVAYLDFGAMNIVIALAIAAFKASLVVLYFMHVKYASKLTQLASVLGFVWLAILLGMTSSGIFTRDWIGSDPGWAMQPLDAGAVHHDAAEGAEHGEEAEAPAEH
ncbi:MAG: cytochrome C oxidase subunit IV family protein [Acidobacteria bacterium]|nr:cytochrome C oxidase subunit IV family protein [Acidobacteriota bacterium]